MRNRERIWLTGIAFTLGAATAVTSSIVLDETFLETGNINAAEADVAILLDEIVDINVPSHDVEARAVPMPTDHETTIQMGRKTHESVDDGTMLTTEPLISVDQPLYRPPDGSLPTDVPQPPNAEQSMEPVVDAATSQAEKVNAPSPAVDATDQPDVLVTTKLMPTEIPQLPNAEQLVEPVVDGATVQFESESAPGLHSELDVDQQPDVLATAQTATEIPQPPNAEQLVEPVIEGTTVQSDPADTSEPSHVGLTDQPDVLATTISSVEIPQPPNAEQLVEPVVDGTTVQSLNQESTKPLNTTISETTDHSEVSSKRIETEKPLPPNAATINGPVVSGTFVASTNTSRTAKPAATVDTSDLRGEVKSSEIPPPSNTKTILEHADASTKPIPATGARDSTKTPMTDPRVQPADAVHADSTKTSQQSCRNTSYERPLCPIWGRTASAPRNTIDRSALRKLLGVADDGVGGEGRSAIASDTVTPTKDGADEKQYTKQDSTPSSTDESKDAKPVSNEFVTGLDDIDNLFEGIDPPDELDVGVDGTSIQEVLMGSATRVLLKRITVGFRFVKGHVMRAKNHVAGRIGTWVEEARPLEWLRNETSEFAPWKVWLDDDGDFAPLRRLRDENGELLLPSKAHVGDALKSIQQSAVDMYHKVEAFLDKLFEGSDSEETDFKFVSATETAWDQRMATPDEKLQE